LRKFLSEDRRDGGGGVAHVQRPRLFLFLVIAEETQQKLGILGGQIKLENRLFDQHMQRLTFAVFQTAGDPFNRLLNIFSFGHNCCHFVASSLKCFKQFSALGNESAQRKNFENTYYNPSEKLTNI